MANKKINGGYVDGFVIPMPKKNLAAYRKMAKEGKQAWLKHGALDYKECVLDDPNMEGSASFSKMGKRGEIIVFSYIVFSSKAHRDKVNKLVMKQFSDPEAKNGNGEKMPFDIKRMFYGGFKVLVG